MPVNLTIKRNFKKEEDKKMFRWFDVYNLYAQSPASGFIGSIYRPKQGDPFRVGFDDSLVFAEFKDAADAVINNSLTNRLGD